jgi:hypothetical protein
MSIKPHVEKLTIIVRTKESSKCLDLIENESNSTDYVYLSKQLYPDLQIDHFENCTNLKVSHRKEKKTDFDDWICFQAQQYIKSYDEKLETQKFKFGIIYQRRGQVILKNSHSINRPNCRFRQQKKNFSIMKDMDDP